ncbi:hypothetical protein CAPTEDRAFT_226663 [Capitella teleta]|uniref:Perilipin n=1 Tax=Capitella teleta TaxID=283909 RepID=R7TQV4_CAPTE|nr:hypothetical protein CAPTEDRAFT_226663 [Capitella teleta]|eukprot:ELT93861.1 hypothetical protein CAPTEDRAFT_226663 [Capitella teleta]
MQGLVRMYRQSLAMKDQESVDNSPFFVQVGSLPVVNSAVGQLLGIYARTKDSNRLVKFTCETAELGVSAAVSTAKPVLTRLPVERLNSVACNQLDNIKKSYPVIAKPTEEVLADTYELYAATLKPTVDRVYSIKETGVKSATAVGQFGVDKVNGVTNYTKGAVVGAKNFGLDRIQGVKDSSLRTVGYLLTTSYGQLVASRLDNWVEVTDGYVEKYLPASEEEKENTEPTTGTLNRVSRLTGKVSRRMLIRASNEANAYRQWTEANLANLGLTLDLVNVAKSNLDAARSVALSQASAFGEGTRKIWEEMQKPGRNEVVREQLLQKMNAAEARLGYIWGEIKRTDVPSNDEKRMEISNFETQLIATARHLTQNLKTHLANLSSQASCLSSVLQERIKEAGSISNAIANIFITTNLSLKDIPQVAVDNALLQFNHLKELVSSFAEESVRTLSGHPNLSWMIPEYDFEGMDLDFGLDTDDATVANGNIDYVAVEREIPLEE